MTEIIMGQVRFVLVTLCLGMIMMLGYDFWRFLRWIIPHCRAVVWTEDILYWTVAAVPAYAVFFIYNNGEIRWYGALADFLGGILYEKGISSVLRRLGRRYLEKPKRRLLCWFSKVWRYFSVKKRMKKIQERVLARRKRALQSSRK